MNFKTTYFLAGLLLAILLLLTLAVYLGPETPGMEGYLLPSVRNSSTKVDSDDIDKVVIDRTKAADGLESLTLIKDAQTGLWSIEAPGPFKADNGLARELVRQLLEARNDDQADRARSDSEWGLDQPSGKVTLSSSKLDKTFEITLGNISPGKDTAVVYMKSSDRTGPIAVLKSTVSNLFKSVKALRDPYLLAPSSTDIARFELSDGKKPPLEIKKTTDTWRYAKPADWGDAEPGAFGVQEAPDKPPSGVNAVLATLSNVRVSFTDDKVNDYVADAATDLAKYGLDPAKDRVLKIAIDRTVTEKSADLGKPGPSKQVPVTLLVALGKKEGDKYFAALDEPQKNIVKISAKEIDPLVKLMDEPGILRERNLLKLGGGRIDAFDLVNASGKLEFRKAEGQSWKLYRAGSTTPTDLDQVAVDALLAPLTQKETIKSFVDGSPKDAELGLDKPQATMSIWLDGIAPPEKKEPKPEEKKDDKKDEKKDEKKDGKKEDKKEEKKEEAKPADEKPKLKGTEPKFRLIFGKTEGPLVVVRRTGAADALVARVGQNLLDLAKRGPIAYLDKTIPPFAVAASPLGGADPTENVTRFKIVREGKTIEVEREKSDAPWKFVTPKEQAGLPVSGNTIRGLIGTLNNLRAVSIASEKAADAQLDKEFGLKTPSTLVVITTGKDKEAKTWEYSFGKEAPDKSGIYAKQGWRDFVYIIDKQVAPTLGAEIAETTLFSNTDVTKVETLKMTGWQAVTGSPFTLDLERKGGKWQAKTPANFAIDSAKVEKFVAELVNQRAEKFISFAGPLKPEQNFDPAKGGMKIEFTLSGDKEVRMLNLGKGEGASLLATSSKPAGAIFTLRKAPFDAVLAKPAYFNP
jgi:hypothetical protein